MTKCNYKLMTGKRKISVLFECGYGFCDDNELCADLIKISDNIYFQNKDENLLSDETEFFYRGRDIRPHL